VNATAADLDVVVIGAGPTGLLLACELELAGSSVALVDQATERSGQSKALGLQPRSAEILQSRGLLDPLRKDAIELVPGGHFAGLPVPLDYHTWDTEFPYQVGIPQAKIEQFLEDRLAQRGVPVQRGLALVGLMQDGDGVAATFEDGTTIRASYLVGCDGGRSMVRKLSGIAFPGRDGRYSAVVADVVLADKRPRQGGWQLPSLVPQDGAVMSTLPLGDDVHRVLFTGPAQQGIAKDQPVTFEEVAVALSNWYGEDVVLTELQWGSRFTDAARQAEQYRWGRLFLAGDAAHIHSPTGGQGMNLGLQDAFNLGWKLAAHLKGEASESLLDSYHNERHPVAAAVLANTRAQGVLMVPDEDVACLRGIFIDLLHLPEANHHLAGLVSGLGVQYDVPCEHPLAGRRMPDVDLRGPGGNTTVFELLHHGRTLALELVTSDLAAKAVVRPDGYVAWASDDPDAEPDVCDSLSVVRFQGMMAERATT
jgi:2-polyprenyl-6-methoxyphenol hydroxylase-like FAD-dependent oxidoreductase